MSVLLDGVSVKDKVTALQTKINRLEGQVARLQARIDVLERKQGISRPRPVFGGKHDEESEDVQCAVC